MSESRDISGMRYASTYAGWNAVPRPKLQQPFQYAYGRDDAMANGLPNMLSRGVLDVHQQQRYLQGTAMPVNEQMYLLPSNQPGQMDREQLVIPKTKKDLNKETSDNIYMEEEDLGLKQRPATKDEPFSKIRSDGSAFKSSQVQNNQLGTTFRAQLNHIEETAPQAKPSLMIQIADLTIDDVEQPDKKEEEQDDEDAESKNDDDEDLFNDDPKPADKKQSPTKPILQQALSKREDDVFDDDNELFLEEPDKKLLTGTSQPVPVKSNAKTQESAAPVQPPTVMEQKIDIALKKEAPLKIEDSRNNEAANNDNEELNSKDDISEEDQNFEVGDNILLALHVKSKRKKDKRKITFKHCILRVEGQEYLIPNAKGEFKWAADRGR